MPSVPPRPSPDSKSQRERFAALADELLPEARELAAADSARLRRVVTKAINSKKLAREVEALLARL